MLTILKSKQICGLDWQRVLPKLTMAIALSIPLLGAIQAEAATTYTIPVTIQAENYSAADGIRNYSTTGGAIYVGAISTGDWMNYLEHKVVIPVSGQYLVSYRVSSPYAGSTFLFNNVGGSISKADRVIVPKTGGWEKWVTVQRIVTLKAGPHTFGIKSTLGGFNINWFSIANVNNSSASSSSLAASSKSSASSLAVSSKVSSAAPVQSSAPSSSKAVSVSSAPAVVSSSKASVAPVSSSSRSSSLISSSSSSKVSSSAVSSSSSSKVSSSVSSSSSSKASSSVPSGYTQVDGPVGLTWIAPKLREDKTILDITELGGYQIRYKSSSDSKYVYVTINDPWTTAYQFDWLEGAYLFEIAAFDKTGILSDFSSFTD